MSHRIAQVESLLKKTISQVLIRDLSDPRIEGLVSVTHVKVSPDLHDAYVYISVLPEKYQKKTLAGLQHANRHIHSKLKAAIALRTVPHLEFRLDETLKRQAAIDAAIIKAREAEGLKPIEPGVTDIEIPDTSAKVPADDGAFVSDLPDVTEEVESVDFEEDTLDDDGDDHSAKD